MVVDLVELDRERLRRDQESESPAGDREPLGERVHDDRPVAPPPERGELPVVHDVLVHLVGDDRQVVPVGERHDLIHRGLREHRSGGVGRTVHDDRARLGCDQTLEGVEVGLELSLLDQGVGDWDRAREPGVGAVKDESGVRDQDLVAPGRTT